MAPLFKALSEREQFHDMTFVKVNGDLAEDVMEAFEISGFPTIVVCETDATNGRIRILDQVVGLKTEAALVEIIVACQERSP